MRPRPAVWRMPLLLALSSGTGLLSALLGEGAWHVLSWAALGWPLAVMLWYGVIR